MCCWIYLLPILFINVWLLFELTSLSQFTHKIAELVLTTPHPTPHSADWFSCRRGIELNYLPNIYLFAADLFDSFIYSADISAVRICCLNEFPQRYQPLGLFNLFLIYLFYAYMCEYLLNVIWYFQLNLSVSAKGLNAFWVNLPKRRQIKSKVIFVLTLIQKESKIPVGLIS